MSTFTGRFSTDFPVATQPVSADVAASVHASAGARIAGSLPIWAVLPTYISWITERGTFTGAGRVGRATGANASFTLLCRRSDVSVEVRGAATWFVSFGAPPDQPLRVGAYEDVGPFLLNRTRAALGVSVGAGGACSQPTTGRFVVHDVDIRPDRTVGRFWATFEQRCAETVVVSGDVRVLNPTSSPPPFDLAPCLR